jgi:hypothetical protein
MSEAYDPVPETVAEALAKWDAGESVFSVEMGGLGPGYEMAIQGLAFELMRAIQAAGFKEWDDDEARQKFSREVLDEVARRCDAEPWGGFSGTQVGAAKNIASCCCRRGYRSALRDPAVRPDRLIQVSKRDLRSAPEPAALSPS